MRCKSIFLLCPLLQLKPNVEILLGRDVSSEESPIDDSELFPLSGTSVHNNSAIVPTILPAPKILTSFNKVVLDI